MKLSHNLISSAVKSLTSAIIEVFEKGVLLSVLCLCYPAQNKTFVLKQFSFHVPGKHSMWAWLMGLSGMSFKGIWFNSLWTGRMVYTIHHLQWRLAKSPSYKYHTFAMMQLIAAVIRRGQPAHVAYLLIYKNMFRWLSFIDYLERELGICIPALLFFGR